VRLIGGDGSGAEAEAVLDADQVLEVHVTQGGSGYTIAPTVTFTWPPVTLDVAVRWVPGLTIQGLPGTRATVQWSTNAQGPWNYWTNFVIGTNGATLADFDAGNETRFYRSASSVVQLATGAGMLVWIPPGRFQMGSPTTEPGHTGDEIQHTVTLSKGFWMGRCEVTQSEYGTVMGSNPSYFKGTNLPVERVGWADATEYCRRLTLLDRAAGRIADHEVYQLPTEAQWEYAARGGAPEPTATAFGSRLGSQWANFNGNFPYNEAAKGPNLQGTVAVGSYAPNAWLLLDMHGNVAEWCLDRYLVYPTKAVTDPVGGATGDELARGGSYHSGQPRGGHSPTCRVDSGPPSWGSVSYSSRPPERGFREQRGWARVDGTDHAEAVGWIGSVRSAL
jgi:formylglycine-generating enzyme required for sulfatase activity